jgi:hypothetical protein
MSWVLIYIATNFLAPIPLISLRIDDFSSHFPPKLKNFATRISQKSVSQKKPACPRVNTSASPLSSWPSSTSDSSPRRPPTARPARTSPRAQLAPLACLAPARPASSSCAHDSAPSSALPDAQRHQLVHSWPPFPSTRPGRRLHPQARNAGHHPSLRLPAHRRTSAPSSSAWSCPTPAHLLRVSARPEIAGRDTS